MRVSQIQLFKPDYMFSFTERFYLFIARILDPQSSGCRGHFRFLVTFSG